MRTDLHLAAERGDEAITAQLLAQRPELVDEVAPNTGTALDCAARAGHDKIVALLLVHCPILLGAKNPGITALHCAAQGGHEKVVTQLLTHSPKLIDAVDANRWTALHFAAQAGHDRIVGQLLANAPTLVNFCGYGWTALHCAVHGGREKIVEQLLEYKPDLIEAVTFDGWTALHCAAQKGYANIVARLLAHDSKSIDAVNSKGMNALHFAAEAGHDEVALQLLARRPSWIAAVTNAGWTPLRCAVSTGQERVMDLLLTVKLEQAQDDRDLEGNTLLHHVLGFTRNATLFSKPLMEKVWRLNMAASHAVNTHAQTPVHVAIHCANWWAVEMLQWQLSVDQIAHAFVACRAPLQRIRPVIDQQCEALLAALNQDVSQIVYEYLELKSNLSRKRRPEQTLPP